MGSLCGLLDAAVAARPDDVALRLDAEELTYAGLGALVDRCSAHLAAAGVGPRSRVALSAGNSAEFVAIVFSVARLGGCTVMISTSWRATEVTHAMAIAEPTHIVHDASGAADLVALAGDLPAITVDSLGAAAPPPPAAADVGEDDLAVMVFSSGTTGLPKAVCHSHRTMLAATDHWVHALGLGPEDRLQIATPPFHILGLLNILAVVRAGASVRLHRRFDLDAVLAAIEADRVTIEMAVAPIALAMAAHPNLERFDLSSLRYIMWGATPVTASVAERLTQRSGVPILPAYGASEVPVLAVNPVDRPDEWRLDCVGLAPPGVELRVVDLASGATLPPGAVGELQARSPSRMIGYLPAEANDESIVDGGWYRTGDVGAVDAGGWVVITDRVKEMIKVNGLQVAPAEVEGVLLSDPQVVDCAVFGVPDERTGEAVVAAVVLAEGATTTAGDLTALVGARLASYKRLADVRFVSAVPRLPSGKVLRRQLKAEYAG